MIVGFTGTRKHLLVPQLETLCHLLKTRYLNMVEMSRSKVLQMHHGDCVGADEEFHSILHVWGYTHIHIHPPTVDTYRAHCIGEVMYPPKDYLLRNRDIVEASDELIACPSSMTPNTHSGTWWTRSYARESGIPVTTVYPNGDVRRLD